MSISGIYRLTFTRGQDYIGKSTDIERRMFEHGISFRKGTAAKKLMNAFILYGQPQTEILLECHPDHIDLMESVYIIRNVPSLNTNIPIKLSNEEIEILIDNKDQLDLATSTHIKKINRLEGELREIHYQNSSLTTLVSELEYERTEQELETQVGQNMEKLKIAHNALKGQHTALIDEFIKYKSRPWYERIFK